MAKQMYEILEFREPGTGSWFRISPERGGMLTSLGLFGRELLYMNEATFYDPASRLRGGNPVLFPVCGQVRNDQYEWAGVSYPLGSHGFAHKNPWRAEQSDATSIRLVQRWTDETLRCYPFQYELAFTYRLMNGTLTIEQAYANLGGTDMPMYAGLHPYFASDSPVLVCASDARETLEGGVTRPFTGTIDLTGKQGAVTLLGAQERRISFRPVAGERAVTMTCGPEFKYFVLWTTPGEPYVCVEPWMAKLYEIHRREELPIVKAGDTLRTFVSIALADEP